MNILVTGGSGFIGSNLILALLREFKDVNITNLDALTYAADPKFGVGEKWKNYRRIKADICDISKVREIFRAGKFEAVFHLAAESHVDRSITGPSAFVKTNVVGTQALLEAARFYEVKRFIHVSTDEVYGSISKGLFTENSPIQPSSPYSASKAGSDLLVMSYHYTYGFPAIITRCSNNYGPRQHPEKFIPKMITNALRDEKMPVYGKGTNVRDWIHVDDHVRGLITVIQRGKLGEVYNFGGNEERSNLFVAKHILKILGKPESLIEFVEDRLGHDLRYAIDSTKARESFGWEPSVNFDEGLQDVVEWYKWRKS